MSLVSLFLSRPLPLSPSKASPEEYVFYQTLLDYLQEAGRLLTAENIYGTLEEEIGLWQEFWVDFQAATAKLYLSNKDWRGKHLIHQAFSYTGTAANGLTNVWVFTDLAHTMVGASWNPVGDLQIDTFDVISGANTMTISLYLEKGTGKLYATASGAAVFQLQVRFFVFGCSPSKGSVDFTVT